MPAQIVPPDIAEGISRCAEVNAKVRVISGMLATLASRREQFLLTGDPSEVFACLYYHATQIELRFALSKEEPVSTMVLDLIIRFFDAYEHNRQRFKVGGSEAVEGHWRVFYENTTATTSSSVRKIWLLLEAVRAHLIDLARAVREALEDGSSEELLRAAFFEMDGLLGLMASETHKDLLRGCPEMRLLVSIDRAMKFGANYAAPLRRKAWRNAATRSPMLMPHSVPRTTAIISEPLRQGS